MELFTYILLGFISSIFIIILGIFIVEWYKDKSAQKKPLLQNSQVFNFKSGQEALDYLDRLIKEKYTYQLYANLLPIYLDRKIPEKNIVKEIKEKIYVTTVGSLSPEVKREILKYFTQKGIEIYINEKIMIYMNETDFRTAEKFTESFRDLKPDQVEKFL
jgi:uncharacterized protein YneF (UPF0154 family)